MQPLKNLYLKTYVHRLRPRLIRDVLQDLFLLKNDLWAGRLDQLKSSVSAVRTLSELQKVIKTLKNNQTRDPNGMINELFKPGVIG